MLCIFREARQAAVGCLEHVAHVVEVPGDHAAANAGRADVRDRLIDGGLQVAERGGPGFETWALGWLDAPADATLDTAQP